ncbi:hypothetical protein MVEN_02493500 [Mycena venus]|uniref:Uncharacterized protein n=1 Tax=Mycena venus TaxID=2733690 RepID=A0A8H7CCK0_9AGAR|nr:hypothetical protein MVEN_02493500 [Mycena venus]
MSATHFLVRSTSCLLPFRRFCTPSPHSLPPTLAAIPDLSLLSSMLPPRDLAYSLFGAPLILDVGPTVNGEIIRVRVQPINTISVSALVISVLLFMGFMYFYLYLLCHKRRTITSQRVSSDAEQPEIHIDEEEKRSLLSWLHFRSRDRFSTAAYDSPLPKPSPGFASPPGLKRNPSSFARGSLIPHLPPVMLASPPPAYASRPSSPYPSRPNTPLGWSRVPSPLGSPRSEASKSNSPQTPSLSPPFPALPSPIMRVASERTSKTSRVQFNPRHSAPSCPPIASPPHQSRGRGDTVPSPTRLAVRSFMTPRSVSAHTLHPEAADLPIPSRARVYTTGETNGSEGTTIRCVARPGEGAGLGLGVGIGLAARGRILTRGPSAVWSPEVAGTGVGPRF